MPPILSFILEAAQWTSHKETKSNECVENALECWSWASVALFTCKKSCLSGSSLTSALEFVLVFPE